MSLHAAAREKGMQPRPAGAERLQRFLARAGWGSRRSCEVLIREGRVMVNGVVVRAMGTAVLPGRDTVRVDGRTIQPQRLLTLMLHKPAGTVTTLKDPEGRRLVTDLLPPDLPRLYPVGRLDYWTEGLLLLTNDGHLALHLSHPRYGVPKVYEVKVKGIPAPEALRQLVAGIRSRGEPLRALRARQLRVAQKNATLEVVVSEGRHHHVRRLCEAIGHPALRVVRVALGPLRLGDLPRGAFRPLNAAELHALRDLIGGAPKRAAVGPPSASGPDRSRTRGPPTKAYHLRSLRPFPPQRPARAFIRSGRLPSILPRRRSRETTPTVWAGVSASDGGPDRSLCREAPECSLDTNGQCAGDQWHTACSCPALGSRAAANFFGGWRT